MNIRIKSSGIVASLLAFAMLVSFVVPASSKSLVIQSDSISFRQESSNRTELAYLPGTCDAQVYYGVEHCVDGTGTHYIVVDINDSHVRFQTVLSSGANGECNSVNHNGKDPGSNCSNPYPFEKISSMLSRYKSQGAVALINTDYFGWPDGDHGAEGLAVRNGSRLDGLTHGDYDVNSLNRPSLAISSSKSMAIGVPVNESEIDSNVSGKYYNTVGGMPVIVSNGQTVNTGCSTCTSSAQSAAGITSDGRLILLTAKKTASGMASYLVNNFGVQNALKFDGGGSARLAWLDSNENVQSWGATAEDRPVAEGLLVFSTKISSSPPPPAPQPGDWNVEYFNDTTITSKCAGTLTSEGPFAFKDWGDSSPASGCNSDNWSARFWRTVHFQSGTYNFGLGSDDWSRLIISGDLVLNNWQGTGQHYASRTLSEGDYQVTVEYADTLGSARLAAWWWGPGYDMPTQSRDPNQWYAQYWGNKEIWWDSIVRVNEGTGVLNHAWDSNGPGYGLPNDRFSSRFERQVYFSCGTYQFNVTTDDGVRFWVDGSLQLDKWQDQATSYHATISLQEGYHDLKIEHYENGGGANISLNWTLLSACNNPTLTPSLTFTNTPTATLTPTITPTIASCPPITHWKGEYWNNDSLTGTPTLCRNDFTIDFDWAAGSPDPLISDDHFSARWTKIVNFGGGFYTFSVFHDDGFRLYIDGSLLFENWSDSRGSEAHTALLSSGNHEIKLEVYENGGWAAAKLTWEPYQVSTPTNTPTATSTIASCPTITGWKGEYWNNESLTGTADLCRNDPAIDFEWVAGSPDPLISDDHFSARWTRDIYFSAGRYQFDIFHDDGVRLFIDGSKVFDDWCSGCRELESVYFTMIEGTHRIIMETYDYQGWASARLTWQLDQSPTATPTPTASYTPTPTNTPLPGPLNTGFLYPSSNAAQTGGDGNGYEVNATYAYANDGLFAVDNNSGNNTSTACTNSGKDKHRFYNYGISLPGTVAIQGIEVRIDAKVESASGSPKLCVQLSWDGGSNWTTAKSTGTLSTGEQTFILGGPTDTWGRGWATSQLSNTNFRVRIIDVSSSTSRDFSLDWIAVRLTYR